MLLDKILNISLLGEIKQDAEVNGYLKISSLEKALVLFEEEEFREASAVAWEHMRITIMSNGQTREWEKLFVQGKLIVAEALDNSPRAIKLMAKLGLNRETFIASLPFIGALGESLAYDDYDLRFFNGQLQAYRNGYWVCGWSPNQVDSTLGVGQFYICEVV